MQEILMTPHFGKTVEQIKTPNGFELVSNDKRISFSITIDEPDFVEFKVFRELHKGLEGRDCVKLNGANWYGGPEQIYQQYWPIEKQKYANYDYIPKTGDFMGIAERYWLNSKGSYVYVSFETPLFIDQDPNKELCLIAKKELPYNIDDDEKFEFGYFVGVGKNPKETHLKAIEMHLKKPTGIPDERMAIHPIWSTWARFKTNINESIVEKFADDIVANNFDNSQLEIDDYWEECYGSLTFDKTKFPDMKGFVNRLKTKGFRVTLWVHPFINQDCQPWYNTAIEQKYVVFGHNGSPNTTWWNSRENEASYIDFTKPSAIKWFVDRLHQLRNETGLESFKFDSGEASWAPVNPVLEGDKALHPGLMTRNFCKELSQFGGALEIRTGWGTQDLPHFVRMLDKGSAFLIEENGLESLVTTLLVINMAGYPFVLPDMVGGNGYNNNKELFIRWLEANVFMPTIQFSFAPWDYDAETIEISKKLVKLHETVAGPVIMKAMHKAVKDGTPVNSPIWWIDPENPIAHGIWDRK